MTGLGRWPNGKRPREHLSGPLSLPWRQIARERLHQEEVDAHAKRRGIFSGIVNPITQPEPQQPQEQQHAQPTKITEMSSSNGMQEEQDAAVIPTPPPAFVLVMPRLRLKRCIGTDSESGDIDFIRPKRARLRVKTPRVETYYAAEFKDFADKNRRKKREVAATVQPRDAGGHLLFVTGGRLTWCWRCGRYSSERAHLLRVACPGQPGPGQNYRLKRLKDGKHPVSNKPLEGGSKRLLV